MQKDFDYIQNNIVEYKKLSKEIEDKKEALLSCRNELADLRKDFSMFEKAVYNQKISTLNKTREQLKEEISTLKKQARNIFNETEGLIFEGLSQRFSEVFEIQLSHLYGYKVEAIYPNVGDTFIPEKHMSVATIITHEKHQNNKILKTFDFGLSNVETNTTIKFAKVEMCLYNKKRPIGEIIYPQEDVNV